MGNKRITEKDFWMCTEGNIPTQFQGSFIRQKKASGEIYIVKEDKATVGCLDFGCKKYTMLIAIAIAVAVVALAVVGVITVATGGAALIALGALAGAVGAGIGSVVGGLLCGQKMAGKRKWIEVPKKHKTLFQGHPQVTGDWQMTCPIGGQITFAPHIKSWGQALSLAASGYITDILEGMTKGALVGLGGAAIGGLGSVGSVFSGSASTIAGNVGRVALQGLGRIGTNLAQGFFLDAGSKSVEATANVLQNYGETGNWNVAGDFASGYWDASVEDYNALRNIVTNGGSAADWEAAVMLLAPGGGSNNNNSNTGNGNSNTDGGNGDGNSSDSSTNSEADRNNENNTSTNVVAPGNPNAPTTKKGEAFEDPQKQAQNWQEHENNVTDDLESQNPDVTVGQQITLVVEGIDANGKPFKKRIRIDNLHDTGNGTYQLTDAKFSSVNDLTQATNNQLRNTFTQNQKPVYDAIGGKDGAQIISVIPVGQNASDMGLTPGQPINVEPNVHIAVNNPNGGIVYTDYP